MNVQSLLDLCLGSLVRNVIFPEKNILPKELEIKLNLFRAKYNFLIVLQSYNKAKIIFNKNRSNFNFTKIHQDIQTSDKIIEEISLKFGVRLYPSIFAKNMNAYLFHIPSFIERIVELNILSNQIVKINNTKMRNETNYKFMDLEKNIFYHISQRIFRYYHILVSIYY